MCITCDKKLGFGAMRLPLIDPDDPKHIDLDQVCRMVDDYLEAGFNYFDTAYVYDGGHSEEAVKEALTKRYPRDRFLIPLTPIMKATPRKPCGNASWSVIPASTFCWRTRCLCFS